MSLLSVVEEVLHPDHESPRKNTVELQTSGITLEVVDDLYSDRVRCDHPPADVDGNALGESLVELAEDCGRGRVVALVDAGLAPAMEETGFELEGVIPGFYRGEDDCAVLGYGVEEARMDLAHEEAVRAADKVLQRPWPAVDLEKAPAHISELATLKDAQEIADLLGETFVDYPTPSSNPEYIAEQIESGAPFRIIREGGVIAACASADLVPEALTAELTDCATRPSHRGRGLMQSILHRLMLDLQEMGYPTAFTLARARIPGVNRAFQKLGFKHRGRMARSCRIGKGFEDMNIWSTVITQP